MTTFNLTARDWMTSATQDTMHAIDKRKPGPKYAKKFELFLSGTMI